MSWKNGIAGCFGSVDKQFALHTSDCERAAKLLASANAAGVGYSEYCKEIENWLVSQKCSKEHIAEQMANVRNLAYYFNAD